MEEEILELLQNQFPEIDFVAEEKLMDDGVLSSLAIVSLVAILSDRYHVVIPFSMISAENFNSAKSISKMIITLREGN